MSTALPLFAYPFRTSIALKVVSVFGATNTRELVYNRAFSVVKQTDGQVSTHNSHHYTQAADDSLTEYARQIYKVSSDGDSAEYSLGLLSTKQDGTQELATALKISGAGVSVSGVNLSPNSLSFDSQEGSIYFGGVNKTWRIRMTTDGGVDDLSFEYKIADGSYVSKVLMTKDE